MKALRIVLFFALIAIAFVGGFGYGRWYGPRDHAGASTHKPKGYHCPMHANYRSVKPGDCPICGMKLVPDDDSAQPAGDVAAPMPMGAIRVSPEKQQLIGVKFGEVRSGAGVHSFRSVGQVTMDETRFTHKNKSWHMRLLRKWTIPLRRTFFLRTGENPTRLNRAVSWVLYRMGF